MAQTTTCPDALAAYVAARVADAPALTPSQRDRLTALLRPVPQAVAA
ncbi:hypothetical protein [Citricoccus sp.]|nr:hypothetical protein [Citricoccus sp.]HRO31294.1 hypothetical protein [Citricoccus sp.]